MIHDESLTINESLINFKAKIDLNLFKNFISFISKIQDENLIFIDNDKIDIYSKSKDRETLIDSSIDKKDFRSYEYYEELKIGVNCKLINYILNQIPTENDRNESISLILMKGILAFYIKTDISLFKFNLIEIDQKYQRGELLVHFENEIKIRSENLTKIVNIAEIYSKYLYIELNQTEKEIRFFTKGSIGEFYNSFSFQDDSISILKQNSNPVKIQLKIKNLQDILQSINSSKIETIILNLNEKMPLKIEIKKTDNNPETIFLVAPEAIEDQENYE